MTSDPQWGRQAHHGGEACEPVAQVSQPDTEQILSTTSGRGQDTPRKANAMNPMKLIRILTLVLAALALRPASVWGQELPPGPATLAPLSRMAIEGGTGPFDEAQTLILDFAPGTWSPPHSHGGLTLVRVLEGEMTRRMGDAEDVFRAGEGWVEAPRDVHAAGNAGTAPARVQVTFLLPRGAPLTTVAGTPSPGAPPGPTVAYQSARVPAASTAPFDEAATTVLGFAPGAWTPLHSHGGLTLVAVVEGEMRVRSGGRETVYRAGDLWVEGPGDVHAAGNAAVAEALVAVTFVLRRGAPVTTVVQPAGPISGPIALPRTGAGTRATVPPLAIMGLTVLGVAGALVGRGHLLRRRTRGA